MSAYQYPAAVPYASQAVTDPTAVMGRRIVAWVIDLLLFLLLSSFLGPTPISPLAEYVQVPSGVHDPCGTLRDEGKAAECTYLGDRVYFTTDGDLAAQTLVSLAWFLLIYGVLQGLKGVTPGKALLGVTVVDRQGQPPGVGRSLLRSLLWVVDDFPYCLPLVAPIVAFSSKGHRRVGDMVANTLVVGKAYAGRPVVVPGLTAAPGYAAAGYGAAPPPGAWPSGPGYPGQPQPQAQWGAPPPAPPGAWPSPPGGSAPGTPPAAGPSAGAPYGTPPGGQAPATPPPGAGPYPPTSGGPGTPPPGASGTAPPGGTPPPGAPGTRPPSAGPYAPHPGETPFGTPPGAASSGEVAPAAPPGGEAPERSPDVAPEGSRRAEPAGGDETPSGETPAEPGAGGDVHGPGSPGTTGPVDSPGSAGTAEAAGGRQADAGGYNPQWDAARNTYIVWEPNQGRWLGWDDTAKEWRPL